MNNTKENPPSFENGFSFGAPNRTRTCDTIGQKYGRLTRLVTPHSVGRCLRSRQRGRPPSAAHRDTPYFFLLKHRLNLPQAAAALEPVNSRNLTAETQFQRIECIFQSKRKTPTLLRECFFFGAPNRTRLSACGPRSVAVLTVHRTVIHYRSPSSPDKVQNKKPP